MNENADHEEKNSIGEFEIARLIKECLGRYDTISECNGYEGSQLPCGMGRVVIHDGWGTKPVV
jgi:hypothetical protein